MVTNALWRILYALIVFGLFWWIAPLVIQVFDIPIKAAVWQLIQAVVAALCLCYIIWGPAPRKPFGP
jgi:hypothetical protein